LDICEIFQEKKFIYTAEIFPHKGATTEKMMRKVEVIRRYVDAVNVTDNQRACMRLGSLAISKLLLENGVTPIYQLTCRDRNRLALQSDLLSAYVLGIRNVLILGGDHPQMGDHPEAKPVFDVDTVGLLQIASTLASGRDMTGHKLNGSPTFCLGAAVNPTLSPLELQILSMEKKIEAGARFFQTQVIFDIQQFSRFLEEIDKAGLRKKALILPGVFFIKSLQMLDNLKSVPGVLIPEHFEQKLREAPDLEKESINQSAILVKQLRTMADGVHIMAINSEEHIPEIILKSL